MREEGEKVARTNGEAVVVARGSKPSSSSPKTAGRGGVWELTWARGPGGGSATERVPARPPPFRGSPPFPALGSCAPGPRVEGGDTATGLAAASSARAEASGDRGGRVGGGGGGGAAGAGRRRRRGRGPSSTGGRPAGPLPPPGPHPRFGGSAGGRRIKTSPPNRSRVAPGRLRPRRAGGRPPRVQAQGAKGRAGFGGGGGAGGRLLSRPRAVKEGLLPLSLSDALGSVDCV